MIKLYESWTWNVNTLGFANRESSSSVSKYRNSGRSVLHEPTIRAIVEYVVGNSAIGSNDKGIVAEINDTVVFYSYDSKGFIASKGISSQSSPYRIGMRAESGMELIFTLIPVLMHDDEFHQNYCVIENTVGDDDNVEDAVQSIKNDASAMVALYVICDNVFQRITKEGICSVPSTGNVPTLYLDGATSSRFAPSSTIKGTFHIFSATNAEQEDEKTFSYILDSDREFSPLESSLIPELPDWFIVPKYLRSACKMVTAKLPRPVRNIMLRGEAGTGKTEAAKAMAAALHLPYVSICCHPDMMITDFTGTILPKLQSKTDFNENLPCFKDIEMDAAYAYSEMTGEEAPENITGDDVMQMIIERAVSENSENKGLQYEYCDSALVRAIKYGWLCEIQEPAIIERPGVLTGLNSLLDTCQQVTLPTGEVIKRHPDCVLVVTTNTSYQGCREMNNSVLSRMQFMHDTELPTDSELKDRIKGITGFSNDKILTEMIKVVREIHTFCQERMITDGSCGVRELIDWVQGYSVLGNIIEAADCSIIPSATVDRESQAEIKTACLDPHFSNGVDLTRIA